MIFGEIYLLRNRQNGKLYVGQTVGGIKRRWNAHVGDSKRRPRCYIDRAIGKYGSDSFEIERLDIAQTRQELNELEDSWIDRLNSQVPNGYNVRKNGVGKLMGSSGWSLSDEARAKLRNIFTGAKHTEETRRKMSATRKGRKHSPEHSAAIGRAHRKLTEEQALEIKTATGRQKDIGAKFGVGQSVVWMIKHGRTYASIGSREHVV